MLPLSKPQEAVPLPDPLLWFCSRAGPSSLTRPWGPVPSTADAGPPLLVQGAEGGLIVPAAAPVLRLQFLLCGEEQCLRGVYEE